MNLLGGLCCLYTVIVSQMVKISNFHPMLFQRKIHLRARSTTHTLRWKKLVGRRSLHILFYFKVIIYLSGRGTLPEETACEQQC
jgi:hypothetical protein